MVAGNNEQIWGVIKSFDWVYLGYRAIVISPAVKFMAEE